MSTLHFLLLHRTQHFRLELPFDTATVDELFDAIFKVTMIPPSHQKLLHPNFTHPVKELATTKLSTLFASSEESVDVPNSTTSLSVIKLRVMGPREDELKGMDGVTSANLLHPHTSLSPYRPSASTTSTPIYFNRFLPLTPTHHPLPSALPSPKALGLLERIASDYGVCSIMKKYKWSVQCLSELSPLTSPSLLGVNINHGQEVGLRLRTDDLNAFLHYASIVDVLMHELAHIRFSEHSHDFWHLHLELKRNYRQFSGVKLGGVEVYEPRATVVEKTKVGGNRVGGTTTSKQLEEGEDRRDVFAAAATSRLHLSLQDLDHAKKCGNSQFDSI